MLIKKLNYFCKVTSERYSETLAKIAITIKARLKCNFVLKSVVKWEGNEVE